MAKTATLFQKYHSDRKCLELDEREVSLVDIRMLASNQFLNVSPDRIVIHRPQDYRSSNQFHFFVSEWKPIPPQEFLRHESGQISMCIPKYWTLGQLIEQAKAFPGCSLDETSLTFYTGDLTLYVKQKN